MYNSDLPTRAELPTTRQLVRSTLVAIVAAAVILVTVVLPAEYAIDPTGIGRALGLTQMGEIKAQLAEEAERDRVAGAARSTPGRSTETDPVLASRPASGAAPQSAGGARSDELSVTLEPGEGIEVKVEMSKGAKVVYEWTTSGGPVNHNTHADGPGGNTHLYGKANQVDRDAGELVAPFDGNHGWFWRNRNDRDVTVTLKTSGEYRNLKRV
jgi:hypothetical protein